MAKRSIEFNNATEQQDYFAKIQRTLDMLIHVTDCTESGLISARRYDPLFKDELLAIKNALLAMSYKYRYQHTVENLPSTLKLITEESGMPSISNFREMSMERQNGFSQYKLDTDIQTLKKRLAVIAMEERRISTNLQAQIALSHYQDIVQNKDCYSHWHNVSITEKENDTTEMFLSHFDSAINLPVIYMVEFAAPKTSAQQRTRNNETLIKDFKERVSSTLKLLTLFKALEESHDWLYPVRMTRVYIGPFYMQRHTKHGDPIEVLLNSSEQSAGLGCITVEQLKVRNVSVESGLFSNTKTTEYELDRMRPHLYEAGVTSCTQKVIMPYSMYQTLTEFETHPLSDYQKYVIGNDGDVMVF